MKVWLGGAAWLVLALAVMDWPSTPRLALLVFTAALLAWALTDWDDTWVALVASLGLLAGGVVTPATFYATLGHELLWLMLGAFVLAAAVERSGALQRLAHRMLAGASGVRGLFHRLTWGVAATAFLLPSTSARAALLLPITLALAARLPEGLRLPLLLLVPSVILLSAGASLLGAGAHLLAVEALRQQGGWTLGFLDWALVAAPFALLSCALACELVLRAYVPLALRRTALGAPDGEAAAWTAPQRRVLGLGVLAVAGLASGGWHGVPAPLWLLGIGLLACLPPLSGCDWKQGLKGVEWNLLVFMAATLLLGEALIDSGAAARVAATWHALPGLANAPPSVLWAVVTLLALLSHLLVSSRTARTAVLLPAVGVPAIGLGLDGSLVILALALGSGFCQSLRVSAKPVAMFAEAGAVPAAAWLRLSGLLLLPLWALLMGCTLWLWPWMARTYFG